MTHTETERELAVLNEVRAALKSEIRLGISFNPNRLELDADGVLIFEAEVETVAQKKVALKAAAAPPDRAWVARARDCATVCRCAPGGL